MNNMMDIGASALPPVWVDTAEEVEDMLVQINHQLDKLELAKVNRFKPKFDNREDEELDSEIAVLRNTIYNNLKWSEMKLKQAREQMALQGSGEGDQAVTENVQQAYLAKLKDAAKRLRQIERDHINKIGKLYGVQGEVRLPDISDLDRNEEDDEDGEGQLIEEIKSTDPAIAQLKKQEIESIVGQMNSLSDLFRDVSNLVVEQGSVLDRIDFHIQDSRMQVQKGNKELQKIMDVENNVRVKTV